MAAFTTAEHNRLREFLYARSGIFIGEDKDYFVESRVISRMNSLQMDRFTDYFRYLALESDGQEFAQLINCVTVTETFFFRDYGQLTGFGEEVIPILVAQKEAQGQRNLSVLSAGCASGEEVYSLAIILREMLPSFDEWRLQVDAVDINTDMLDRAKRATYGARSTRDVPITYRLRYFEERGDELVVKPAIRNMVRVEYANLYDPRQMARYQGVDVVFCRNVLIYFDDDSRRRVLNNVYNLLNPGGVVFLGYAESVSRYSGAFEVVRIGDFIVHRKPLAGARAGKDSLR